MLTYLQNVLLDATCGKNDEGLTQPLCLHDSIGWMPLQYVSSLDTTEYSVTPHVF